MSSILPEVLFECCVPWSFHSLKYSDPHGYFVAIFVCRAGLKCENLLPLVVQEIDGILFLLLKLGTLAAVAPVCPILSPCQGLLEAS